MSDVDLLEVFKEYKSVRSAKVVVDVSTGVSKGYGFVRFTDFQEQQHAMIQKKGVLW